MVSQFINRLVKGKAVALGEELLEAIVSYNADPKKPMQLVEKGADITLRARFGQTALHKAVPTHALLPLVELLLAKGADPNARDNNGHTPLSYCMRNDDGTITALLLKSGARAMLVEKNPNLGRYSRNDAVEKLMCEACDTEKAQAFTVRETMTLKTPKLKIPRR